MFVIASREKWVIIISGGRSSRRVRGGAVSINSIVQTHDGMIGRAIEFKKRSLYPIGQFKKLIQDSLHVRGASSLIGERTTEMLNCLCASRLIPEGSERTKGRDN